VLEHETIRQQLLKRREELNQRVHRLADKSRHIDDPLPPDFSEQAVERQNDEVLDALGDVGRRELIQINRALASIEAGEYGTCARCGNTIPEQRLEILPYSDLCVSCAELEDNQ
jgi:RNA polymerase-binding transcription factor DksA